MRILVIGAEGQVARSLREIAGEGVTIGCSKRPEVDILRANSIESALTAFSPDIVVNPAAYTAVDQAESEVEAAFAINADGAKNVATAAARIGVPIIHLSTDYVFDGKKTESYLETDPVSPQGVYGRSKLAGEIAVAAANERHVILRTSWVYAPFGNNFVRTMLRLSKQRDRLTVVDDQIGCPTLASDLARAIVEIARKVSTDWDKQLGGVTHICGPDEVSWYQFACKIMHFSRLISGHSVAVEPIPSRDYPTAATRPANSRLCCQRLASIFGIQMPPLEVSLEQCMERYFSLQRESRS